MDKKTKSNCNTSQGVVRNLSRIPSWLAYTMTLIPLFSGILYAVGAFWSLLLLLATPPAVHPSTVLMIGGGVGVAMLVPVSFTIYLAKEVMSLRARLDAAEKSAQQGVGGDADLLKADEADSG